MFYKKRETNYTYCFTEKKNFRKKYLFENPEKLEYCKNLKKFFVEETDID